MDVSLVEENGHYFLRTQEGMALYRYDLDKDGKPHCAGECAKLWPPFLASVGASEVGRWKTIQRGTGRQWSYQGAPIYTYANDKPGSQARDGIAGLWHVVFP